MAAGETKRRVVARVDAGRLAGGDHRIALPVGGLPAGLYAVRATADGRTVAAEPLTVAR